jgi:hypothetical protein
VLVRLISFDFVTIFIKAIVDNLELYDFFIGGDMPCGGSRPNSGRKKGSKNLRPRRIVVADGKRLADLAREYTAEATMTLVDIMRHADSDHARISAAGHLLDRGHGKTPQGSVIDPRKQAAGSASVSNEPSSVREHLLFMNKEGTTPEMLRRWADNMEQYLREEQAAQRLLEEQAAQRPVSEHKYSPQHGRHSKVRPVEESLSVGTSAAVRN